MPRTHPCQVLSFIACISAIVLLAAYPAAAAPQKPAAPPPTAQAQLEARVKELETRLNEAEKKAALAAMEKDYITRTQKQYETYYQSAFNTQVWVLSILGLTLSTLFFLAGKFGFDIFNRRIDTALEATSAQLKALEEDLTKRITDLEDGLAKRITQQEQDLKTQSKFQFFFAQALTLGSHKRRDDAKTLYRAALKIYGSGKARQLIPKKSGVLAARNLFRQFQKKDDASSVENAKKELALDLYNDLEDELALAAVELDWLGSLLKERKSAPSATVAAEVKTAEPAPFEPTPAPTSREEK